LDQEVLLQPSRGAGGGASLQDTLGTWDAQGGLTLMPSSQTRTLIPEWACPRLRKVGTNQV
ncbi:hypothetical protein P7K49_040137, partial [Saguinus oedipus]